MYKKLYIIIIFALGVTFASPGSVAAQTFMPAEIRQAQITALWEQIYTLQELLDTLVAAQKETVTVRIDASQEEPEEEFVLTSTKFFGTDFDAIYSVDDDLGLTRRDIQSGVRVSDIRLWDLFMDTIGRSEARKYIDEFRVYDNSTSYIGGFVELRAKGDDRYWILGVNNDDFNPARDESRRIYEILFVHEYSHLFLYDRPELVEAFTDRFWTREDLEHARSVQALPDQALEDALEEYYEDNEDRFVSDYATVDPEEDFAESITYYVINGVPRGREEWAHKIRFLDDFSFLRNIRLELRDNLDI